jgi:hypothetical protein
MRLNEDITMYENHTDMHYDLIFTPAGDVVGTDDRDHSHNVRIDENKIVKNGCNGVCDCEDCDDISGDNITW